MRNDGRKSDQWWKDSKIQHLDSFLSYGKHINHIPKGGKTYLPLYEQSHLSCHQPKPTSELSKVISIPSELHRGSKAVHATHRRGKWGLVVNINHALKASCRIPYLFNRIQYTASSTLFICAVENLFVHCEDVLARSLFIDLMECWMANS